jgi:AbrB family looped-hinge helix DNA binding protein
MQVTPDSTHRIVLTKEIRSALNLKPGEPLNVSISAGAVFLTPAKRKGKLVRKGKIKVYTGEIPNIDVEEAIHKARQYPRL